MKADVRNLLNVKKLSTVPVMPTVVVKGIAKRDKEGNLTILATGVFVRE